MNQSSPTQTKPKRLEEPHVSVVKKDLSFVENEGWKLHVYKYDHTIPRSLRAEFNDNSNSLEMILAEMEKNKHAIQLAKEIERVTYEGSVDHSLTENIHKQVGGTKPKPNVFLQRIKPPTQPLSREAMYRFVHSHYPHLKWEEMSLENKCNQTDNFETLRI